jgi:hypothetical protein
MMGNQNLIDGRGSSLETEHITVVIVRNVPANCVQVLIPEYRQVRLELHWGCLLDQMKSTNRAETA